MLPTSLKVAPSPLSDPANFWNFSHRSGVTLIVVLTEPESRKSNVTFVTSHTSFGMFIVIKWTDADLVEASMNELASAVGSTYRKRKSAPYTFAFGNCVCSRARGCMRACNALVLRCVTCVACVRAHVCMHLQVHMHMRTYANEVVPK